MGNISRLREAEIANGNLINADDLDAELDQLVTEANNKETRIATIESGSFTQSGTLTTSNNLVSNGITERTAGSGVTADGTLLKDGYVNIGAIRTTLSATDTTTDVITTASNHGLVTGDTLKLRAVSGGTLPGGTANTTVYYLRRLSDTTGTLHTTLADANANTNIVNLSSAHTGTVQVIAAVASPSEYDLYVDPTGLRVRIGGSTKIVSTQDSVAFPQNFQSCAPPVYASASTFSVASIACRDSTNAVNIGKTSSTTVDIATTGLNGTVQSANLTGDMSYSSAAAGFIASAVAGTDVITTAGSHGFTTGQPIRYSSSTVGGVSTNTTYYINVISATTHYLYNTRANAVAGGATGRVDVSSSGTAAASDALIGEGTLFTTELTVGDIVTLANGQVIIIGAITSDTVATSLSGYVPSGNFYAQTFKRGGEIKSTWYYLYAITDGTTPGLILSKRNVAGGETLIDLPSGYTYYRQLPFAVRNDASSNFVRWVANVWGANTADINFTGEVSYYNGSFQAGTTFNIVSAGTGATGVSTGAPPIAYSIRMASLAGAGSSYFTAKPTGTAFTAPVSLTFNNAVATEHIIELGTSQQIDYTRVNGTGNVFLDMIGMQVRVS